MNKKSNVSISIGNVFQLLGERLYSDSKVFIRENVQNAIDAIRLLKRDGLLENSDTRVEVRVQEHKIEVEDWGIGMSEDDIKNYFWTIGKSSKNNKDAQLCDVIGRFGIGAFANFGVCRSLTVESWRSGGENVKSSVIKADLLKDLTEYTITSDSRLNHFGTLIIGETERSIDPNELKIYLEGHIKYLPEKVFFNNQLISGKDFQILPKGAKFLSTSGFVFSGIKVKADYFLFQEKLYIELTSLSSEMKILGLLSPEVGKFNVYLNRFLISTITRLPWDYERLSFSGFIETNFIEPNITREALDVKSLPIFEALIDNLTRETLKVLSLQDMIFQHPDVATYITHQPLEKAATYLKDYSVHLYGSKSPVKLADIADRSKRAGSKIILVENESPPVSIASISVGQNVMPVMLSDLTPDLRRLVSRYLKEYASAITMSDFELESIPIEENKITPKMRAIRTVIQEILTEIWALSEPQVTLCEFDGNQHIAIQQLDKEIKILVNVKSNIFQQLTESANESWVKAATNQILISPCLGDTLIKLLPKDYSAAIAMFKPKPHKIRIEKVSLLNLVRGSRLWKGPDEGCIEIHSVFFKEMEGYYIKLPGSIGEQLKPIVASSNPPTYLWFADTVVGLFQTHSKSLLIIQIKSRDLITSQGRIQGTVKAAKRALIYETGVYIPIPAPQLKDLLPLEGTKELEIGFRGFGLENENETAIPDADILK